MKVSNILIGIIILLVILIAIFPNEHKCKYPKCPYKGVLIYDAKQAIILYTGSDPGTDAYLVDSLHFVHPEMDYDQIDSILFTH